MTRAYLVISDSGSVDGIGVETAWARDEFSQDMVSKGWNLVWMDLDKAQALFGEQVFLSLEVLETEDA